MLIDDFLCETDLEQIKKWIDETFEEPDFEDMGNDGVDVEDDL